MIDELFTPDLLPTLRRLGERPIGVDTLDPDESAARDGVWQVLRDLGVPALTRPERHRELLDVAERLGRALYRCPLLETATAAALIEAGGDPLDLLPGIGEGTVNAVVVSPGTLVPFAADADWFVVGDEVFPRDRMRLRRRDDITRGDLYTATVDGAPAARLDLTDAARTAARDGARLRQAAYLTGMAAGALALTVDYTRTRRQFGQPVSRFQAPAFRLAALYARIEATRALVSRADGSADALRALLLAGELARDASAEAVQLHGAHGMTERADAQLFYRHAALESIRLGTPSALRVELGAVLCC